MSSTELEAKRYLHACINAVTVAVVETGMTKAFDGQSCDNSAFDIARFFDGKSNTPAVSKSRIRFGNAGLEDFRIEVTDTGGQTWTGSLSNYPKWPPRPRTPQQQAQAQVAAYQVAAQNIARSCIMAIEQYKADNAEQPNPDWNGKGCIEAGLVAADSRAAIEKSLITLHPEMQEGYQVTIWPRLGGQAVKIPAELTLKPTKWQEFLVFVRNNPGQVFSLAVGSLVSAVLLFFCTFKLPSKVKVGSGGLFAGGTLLVLLGLLVFSSRSGNSFGEVSGYIAFALIGLLMAGLLFAVPRLAYWFGREKWWASLGMGMACALAVLLSLVLLGTLLPSELNIYLPQPVYGFPFVSLGLTLYALWQRWHNRRLKSTTS